MLEQIPPEIIGVATLLAGAAAAYFRNEQKKAKSKYLKAESDLRGFLREQGIFPNPETQEISRKFIDDALEEKIDAYDGSAVPIRTVFSDGTYYAPKNEETMIEARKFNLFEYLPYRPAFFDCENFAMAYATLSAFLWGTNCVGIAFDWSAGHAYNIIVYADGTVELYEPQESKVVEFGDVLAGSESDYKLDNGLVLF